MKKISLIILAFLLVSLKVSAQLPGVYFGELSTAGKTLIVVVDEKEEKNKGFKAVLEEVMPSEWTLTPFKILTEEEYVKSADTYRNNPNNIFMSFNYYGVKEIVGGGLIFKNVYNREILLGNKIKENGKVVRASTIIYLMSLPDDMGGNLKADVIKDFTVLKKLIANQKTQKDRVNPAPIIKQKTLYINKIHLGKRTEEDIKKVYPYPFKIVEPSEYAEAIVKKNTDVLFFEYVRAEKMPTIYVFSMDSESPLLWCQDARGVNNYVHINFQVLAKKLKK